MAVDIKPQIITAFFDIGRDKWKYHGSSVHTYLHWGANVLKLDNPMVIYTEPKFEDEIRSRRYHKDTKIVIMEINELKAYKKYYSQMERMMLSEPFKSFKSFNVPEMLYPLYNVIMFNKMYWIKDAIDNNYFDSNISMWIDYGYWREPTDELEIKWPSKCKLDLDRITYFSHHERISIHNIKDHAMSQMRFIQGGNFSVPNDKIDQLVLDVESTIQTSLDNGYIGSDEKMFDIAYLKTPWLYKLIKADWRESITLWA